MTIELLDSISKSATIFQLVFTKRVIFSKR